MADAIWVNLHCHSSFSDGDQTPEVLAGNLAGAGVRCAALTDHDTLEGLPRFADALKKRGIAYVSGVEITTQYAGQSLHLLGYGFDPQHAELTTTLLSLRQSRTVEVQSIAGTLRRASEPDKLNAASKGTLDTGEAIALVHRAGGLAFLAHPLVHEPDLGKLDALVAGLAAMGLDGIEATYTAFTPAQQAALREMARRHGLHACAGTDFHSANKPGLSDYAIAMPREDWVAKTGLIFARHFLQPAPKRKVKCSRHLLFPSPTGRGRGWSSTRLSARKPGRQIRSHIAFAGVLLPCASCCPRWWRWACSLLHFGDSFCLPLKTRCSSASAR